MTRQPKGSAMATDMRSVVSDVENLLHEVGSSAGGTVHEFKSRVSHALDAARERLDQLDGSVRSGARQAVTTTDDYAHAHPWHVLAAGALVGLALGFLLTRR
jgi:ElaB/YqjD/DUF883 family membrane-anchored ribosome-binding protein